MAGIQTPAASSMKATVLVVEDEQVLRQAVVRILRKAGYQVLEAADGSAAIEILRGSSRKIDLILLDVTMPGASSHEIVVDVAKSRPDTRVILTSAYSQEMVVDGRAGSQICGFVRKPFQMANLLQMLRDTLSVAESR